MRRITLAVMGTISALVVLFSYHTSTDSPSAAGDDQPSTGSGSSASGSSGSGGSGSGSSGSASSGSGTSHSGAFTGDEADTQWGVVQVRITVEAGKITKSEAVEYPANNMRDQQINAFALPQLADEVVQAQGADIDAVSGATVTSDGYIQSLQSALDRANL